MAGLVMAPTWAWVIRGISRPLAVLVRSSRELALGVLMPRPREPVVKATSDPFKVMGLAPAGPAGPVAPVAPVNPISPWGPVAPVAPVGPAGPWGPGVPATVPGTHLAPLNTSPCPEVGAVVVKSRGVPCRFDRSVCVWVPVRSPLKAPTSSQADRAWKAGIKSTSGLMVTLLMTTRSFKSDRPSRLALMGVMPVEPSTTE